MVTIGILALQGAVNEHMRAVEACGARAIQVKNKEQLQNIDGLILPGGESTTMRRLITSYDFAASITEFGKHGKPIFGTCAGLILMANEVEGETTKQLGLIDMKVIRNAFGRQIASFETELAIAYIAERFTGVFIRAPYISQIGPQVEVLATYNDKIVAVRQDNYLATAFHPELTDDNRVTAYFIDQAKKQSQTTG